MMMNLPCLKGSCPNFLRPIYHTLSASQAPKQGPCPMVNTDAGYSSCFFRILRCCDDKVICYRHIDESLKEDLENMNNGCSKMTLGKNWFISAIKHDKFENSYTFALYNGSAEIMTMKEYICYQVNYFFESLLGLAEKKNGDVEISIRNMIYENAIAFVDRKINNTINMAMGPRIFFHNTSFILISISVYILHVFLPILSSLNLLIL